MRSRIALLVMKIVRLKSWKSFTHHVEAVVAESKALRQEASSHVSTPVFRGHANAKWTLSTTLERESGDGISLKHFYQQVLYPSLRMLRGELNFELPELGDLNLPLRDIPHQLPMQEQLAMLRHHGAPSPLLDWSYSPYVAAYFAFAPPVAPKTRNVAVYAFREFVGEGKGYEGDKSRIGVIGRWAAVHGRHIRQQSTYTLCVRDMGGQLVFASHEIPEDAQPFKFLNFDEIIKFEIPIRERDTALEALNLMNVTEYSLFGTQDTLVRTVVRFTSQPD